MNEDLIRRSDAIGACAYETIECYEARKAIRALPSADRPQWEIDAIDRDALIDYCLKLIDVERKQGSDVMNYGQERVNQTEAIIDYIEHMPHVNADRTQEWIPCSERLPETDNTNEINEFDVLLAVRPKKHPERTPQVYIGKLRPVEGDDGSGNFWGVKIAPCEWTIWGWSYFQEPEVLAWMPLPTPWKGADDESN